MKPSRLVTFGGGDVTPSRSGVWAGRRLDGHMARFAFEALGIELTEGQPDTSANKANEKKSRTMKKLIAAAGLGAAVAVGSLVGAGTANASSGSFIDQINAHGWHETNPGYLLNLGYRTCSFLNSGYSVTSVVNDVYYRTDAATSWSQSRRIRLPRR